MTEEEDLQWLARADRVMACQCDLFRDIFTNVLRPGLNCHPAWLTPTVAALAHAASDERIMPSGELDPVRLAVLADALEEAGAAREVLEHLRSGKTHVLGCWAVKACLARC